MDFAALRPDRSCQRSPGSPSSDVGVLLPAVTASSEYGCYVGAEARGGMMAIYLGQDVW
jgi:hypothetical protein